MTLDHEYSGKTLFRFHLKVLEVFIYKIPSEISFWYMSRSGMSSSRPVVVHVLDGPYHSFRSHFGGYT